MSRLAEFRVGAHDGKLFRSFARFRGGIEFAPDISHELVAIFRMDQNVRVATGVSFDVRQEGPVLRVVDRAEVVCLQPKVDGNSVLLGELKLQA